jgi:hypothetical protein
MQGAYPVAGFHAVSLRHALQFSILRLRSTGSTPLTPAAVAAALKATKLRDDELLIQRP